MSERNALAMFRLNGRILFVPIFLAFVVHSEPLFAYRVAIVKSRQLEAYSEAIKGIREGLAESKEDIEIKDYNLDANEENGYQIAQEILDHKSHLVFTVGTEAARSLLRKIAPTPLVATMIHDPSKELEKGKAPIPSLYGIPLKVPMRTQVELIKELTPQLTSFTIDCGSLDAELKGEVASSFQEAALSMNCISLDEKKDVSTQLADAKEKSAAFFFVLPTTPYHKSTIDEILLFSVRNKYPVISFSSSHVRSGALMSFSYRFYDTGLEAARLGVQILGGTPISKRFRFLKEVVVSWNQNVSKSFEISLPKKKDLTIEFI